MPLHRQMSLGVILSFLVIAFPQTRADSQEVALPESTLVSVTSPAIFQTFSYEIARAALGTQHAVTIDFPEGPFWARVGGHFLKAMNGHPPTSKDTLVNAVRIKNIYFAGDTLVVAVISEIREHCPNNQWISTGTEYEFRRVRHRSSRGDSWEEHKLVRQSFWDSFGCDMLQKKDSVRK